MKKINFLKIFLIAILAFTWIYGSYYCVNTIVQKKGYEEFARKMHTTPDYLALHVWKLDGGGYETYQTLMDKYSDDKNVISISQNYGWENVSCAELEEELGRDTWLIGRVYSELLQYAMADEIINELQKNEVLIPKYFKPCEIGRYGNKDYIDGEELVGKILTIPETQIELKVVGTFDNVKHGITGNQILYSYETHKEMVQKIYELSEQELENFLIDEYQIIQICPKNYEAKQVLLADLKEEYGDLVSEETGYINVVEWDSTAEYNAAVMKRAILLYSVLTIVFVVLTIMLLKKEIGLRKTFGSECLIMVVGLVYGIIRNYNYIKEENALLQQKPEEFTRLLEYPIQPLYWTVGIAVVLGIVGTILILIKRKRKTGEMENA